jgi:DNA-binding transcriptional LysR family regulator
MITIDAMNISAVDLNLLAALEALLEERNVTRAARRVGLSQPAMSNALGRLRALFGDELLHRQGPGMELTERGARLVPEVAAALAAIRRVLAPPPAFAPERAEREFVIGLTDYAEALLLPRVVARVARKAPGVVLRGARADNLFLAPEQELAEGRFDLALGFFGPAPAPHGALRGEALWRERNVCVSAANHPRLKGRAVSEDGFLSERHVAVFYRRGGPGLMDSVLAGRGRARRVSFYTPHFSAVFGVLAESELVAAAPERLAKLYAKSLPLRLRALPVVFPEFEFAMLWHQRRQSDEGLAWLREQVSAVAAMASTPA